MPNIPFWKHIILLIYAMIIIPVLFLVLFLPLSSMVFTPIHELVHLLMAIIFGVKITEIRLWSVGKPYLTMTASAVYQEGVLIRDISRLPAVGKLIIYLLCQISRFFAKPALVRGVFYNLANWKNRVIWLAGPLVDSVICYMLLSLFLRLDGLNAKGWLFLLNYYCLNAGIMEAIGVVVELRRFFFGKHTKNNK